MKYVLQSPRVEFQTACGEACYAQTKRRTLGSAASRIPEAAPPDGMAARRSTFKGFCNIFINLFFRTLNL